MSSITPISLGVDLASLGRSADPVYRPARTHVEPVVQPPAVILPRTAAWLNVPVAPDLTASDTSDSGSVGSDQAGQSADSAAQPSLVASLNAQSAVANAASTTAASQSAAQDAQPAGFGSVVQLV